MPFGDGAAAGGKLSVNGIFAKIARLAASKAAAFCYAVAVGVAGNLIFHMVQTHGAAPAASPIPASEVREAAPPESARHIAVIPAQPAPAPARETAPTRNLPHSHAHAAVPRSPAAAPPLPETPAVALPNPDSFQAPPLKPAALPGSAAPAQFPAPGPLLAPNTKPNAPPAEADRSPAPQPDRPAPVEPTAPPHSVALQPLGPPIDVAPPVPPAEPATPPTAAAQPLPTAGTKVKREAPNGIEFSDLWHPYRAVKKGVGWAGRQLPTIGSDDSEPPPKAVAPAPTAVSAPIPLLPPPDKRDPAAHRPDNPGPGSGGLY